MGKDEVIAARAREKTVRYLELGTSFTLRNTKSKVNQNQTFRVALFAKTRRQRHYAPSPPLTPTPEPTESGTAKSKSQKLKSRS